MNHVSGGAAVSPDGLFAAVSNMYSGFDIYETCNGQLHKPIYLGSVAADSMDRPLPVQYVSNGRVLVGGSAVGIAGLFDAQSGKKLQKLEHNGKAHIICLK